MKKDEWKDFTTGSIWKKLLHFMVPLMLASLIQQLYNMVDLMFAGHVVYCIIKVQKVAKQKCR